jgi:hypothetical protein
MVCCLIKQQVLLHSVVLKQWDNFTFTLHHTAKIKFYLEKKNTFVVAFLQQQVTEGYKAMLQNCQVQ